jgi:ATP-dependent DNA helicase DinG
MDGKGEIPSRRELVDAFFGAKGYLSKIIPDYAPRPGQVVLARAVNDALVEKKHLLSEAGTAVGKSFGYGVPASYHAWETKKPVVIVTANIALQEQLVLKDLPTIQKLVPWPFTFALMKGRNHYLCESKRLEYEARREGKFLEAASDEERRQLEVIGQWARQSADAGLQVESGDVSELPFEPLSQIWRQFSVSSDECKKGKCQYKDECFANYAMDHARRSQVVVTNYHMLFAHIQVYLASGMDLVLPPFETCILDEAHKCADIARDFFGFRISADAIYRLGRKVQKENYMVNEQLYESTTQFFHAMSRLRRDTKRYKARITGDFTEEELYVGKRLVTSLQAVEKVFEKRFSDTEAACAFTVDEAAIDGLGTAERDLDRCKEILSGVTQLLHPKDHLSNVFYLEEDEKKRTILASKLVYASSILGPALFNKHSSTMKIDELGAPYAERGDQVTVIATSATITTSGGSFDFIAQELGVPDEHSEISVASPFDWPNQCLFVMPKELPEPNEKDFKEAVAKTVEKIVLLARGRTLGLFTSRRILEFTHEQIASTLRANGIRLLCQGEMPRTKLIEAFKSDVTSVLLGTESLWAGVDVPGEACSVVVIDRIPFPTPDDPVLDVLSEADDKWFFKFAVPRAMIQLRQGFGRLIRSKNCRGVVVCLDRRLDTKKYGKDFLRSLPPVPKSQRLESIVEWLG